MSCNSETIIHAYNYSGGGGGSGTVTSVGLTMPAEFTVTNSPITTTGTITVAFASVANGNKVLASPDGVGGLPTFRALVAADLISGADKQTLYFNGLGKTLTPTNAITCDGTRVGIKINPVAGQSLSIDATGTDIALKCTAVNGVAIYGNASGNSSAGYFTHNGTGGSCVKIDIGTTSGVNIFECIKSTYTPFSIDSVGNVLLKTVDGVNAPAIKFFDAGGSNYLLLSIPTPLSATVVNFKLPANNGTNNYPLTTDGTGSTSWRLLTVAGGGTGVTSFTAYGVLCGGTSSGSDLQSVASVGTAGQVLTSNGAGALPTFQTPAGGGAGNVVTIATGTFTNSPDFNNCAINVTAGNGGVSFTLAGNHLGVAQNYTCTLTCSGLTAGNSYLYDVKLIQGVANNTILFAAGGSNVLQMLSVTTPAISSASGGITWIRLRFEATSATTANISYDNLVMVV